MRAGIFAIIGFAAVILVGVALAAVLGIVNVGADRPDSALMRDFLVYARERSVETRAAHIQVPRLDNPQMIVEGASHYDAMCTGCHLAPGMSENEMRPGMNPKPPLLAKGPADDPAEQFWIIKHGIRMTAMPAWGATHTDQEIWNIVALLQRLPKLSPEEYKSLVAQSGGHHDNGEDQMQMPMDH